MATLKFSYRVSLVPPRFWHHRWHWNRWSLTRFEGRDHKPVGTWMLVAGPLTITRLVDLRHSRV